MSSKKYVVHLGLETVMYAQVHVEAENEEQAQEIAQKRVDEGEVIFNPQECIDTSENYVVFTDEEN